MGKSSIVLSSIHEDRAAISNPDSLYFRKMWVDGEDFAYLSEGVDFVFHDHNRTVERCTLSLQEKLSTISGGDQNLSRFLTKLRTGFAGCVVLSMRQSVILGMRGPTAGIATMEI